MLYEIIHTTQYQYQEVVLGYHSLACLKPRELPYQHCREFSLTITPEADEIVERIDFFGNCLHYFSSQLPHKRLSVTARSKVERLTKNVDYMTNAISCRDARVVYETDTSIRNLLQFMLPSTHITLEREVVEFAGSCFSDERPLFNCLQLLCHKIYTEFTFVPNFTTVSTPVTEVLRERKGVCQDFSHLAIACIRSMGFAARYVSGYLETISAPGQQKLTGSDASHAWISVYVPNLGWCDFDPTNNLVPADRHITTSWGRDYNDVPPLKGIIFSSGQHELNVSVDVNAIRE